MKSGFNAAGVEFARAKMLKEKQDRFGIGSRLFHKDAHELERDEKDAEGASLTPLMQSLLGVQETQHSTQILEYGDAMDKGLLLLEESCRGGRDIRQILNDKLQAEQMSKAKIDQDAQKSLDRFKTLQLSGGVEKALRQDVRSAEVSYKKKTGHKMPSDQRGLLEHLASEQQRIQSVVMPPDIAPFVPAKHLVETPFMQQQRERERREVQEIRDRRARDEKKFQTLSSNNSGDVRSVTTVLATGSLSSSASSSVSTVNATVNSSHSSPKLEEKEKQEARRLMPPPPPRVQSTSEKNEKVVEKNVLGTRRRSLNLLVPTPSSGFFSKNFPKLPSISEEQPVKKKETYESADDWLSRLSPQEKEERIAEARRKAQELTHQKPPDLQDIELSFHSSPPQQEETVSAQKKDNKKTETSQSQQRPPSLDLWKQYQDRFHDGVEIKEKQDCQSWIARLNERQMILDKSFLGMALEFLSSDDKKMQEKGIVLAKKLLLVQDHNKKNSRKPAFDQRKLGLAAFFDKI